MVLNCRVEAKGRRVIFRLFRSRSVLNTRLSAKLSPACDDCAEVSSSLASGGAQLLTFPIPS
jgi:hypothetical protein